MSLGRSFNFWRWELVSSRHQVRLPEFFISFLVFVEYLGLRMSCWSSAPGPASFRDVDGPKASGQATVAEFTSDFLRGRLPAAPDPDGFQTHSGGCF